MTEVHWNNNNHFIHYGGAGLDMFQMIGYDPSIDSKFKGQSELGFEFDDVARQASIDSLNEQIPRLIFAHEEGISFGELFVSTCNESPASAEIYRSAISKMVERKIVDVTSIDGTQRRSGLAIKATDQITPSRQRQFFID